MKSFSRIALVALVLAASSARALAEESWIALRSLPVQPVSIAVDAADPNVAWAAGVVLDPWTEKLMKSTDRGASWTEVVAGCSRHWFVATDPSSPGTVYASGYGCGLNRSEDGGRTWRSLLTGIRGWVQRVVIHPRRPSTLYAVSDQDDSCGGGTCLYRSLDRGQTWQRVPAPDSNDPVVLALDPAAQATVFFGSRAGLFRSIDGGTTWTRTDDPRFDSGVNDVVFDPADPAVVYVVGTGIARSADGGRTWVSVGLDGQFPISITIDGRSSPPILWAAGGAGAFRSRDLGATWELRRDGIAAYSDVYRLVLSAGEAPTLYAVTDSGLYSLVEGVPNSYLIPSAARAPGAHGAFYTTDLAIANPGSADASFTIRFLGHDIEGTSGPTTTRTLAAGRAVTYADVLGSLFGIESGYGALRIVSDSTALRLTAFTSTPSPDGRGRVGQAVPAFDATRLASPGSPAVLVGLREDASVRTNLVLASASEFPVTVELTLSGADGAVLGRATRELAALGMTQVSSVVSALGGSAAGGAYLVVRVATAGGAVAAYASVTDNGTNDPRTVLP